MKIIGDQITMIELDKFRIPCATFQALSATSQLANLELARHDVLDHLETSQPPEVLEEEGAEEPIPVKKDSCQQHSRMLKFKAPDEPCLNLDLSKYDRPKKSSGKLRHMASLIKGNRQSNHSVSSEMSSPGKSFRRGTFSLAQNSMYLPQNAQKSTLGSVENMTLLNLKELSGRKQGSQNMNITVNASSSRANGQPYSPTQPLSTSQRARPVKLDTTEFQT